MIVTTVYSAMCSLCIITHRRYPNDGEEDDELDMDDEEMFEIDDADTIQMGKHAQNNTPPSMPMPNDHNAAASTPSPADPTTAHNPDSAESGDAERFAMDDPPLPEEEPELIGMPKAPKIQLNHDAPLHANSQSLFKSLRGWLFGDDSDEEGKVSGDNAYSSNRLRSQDAVLAHALRAEGWKTHPEHFTGAAYTGNVDHADQPDKYTAVLFCALPCKNL